MMKRGIVGGLFFLLIALYLFGQTKPTPTKQTKAKPAVQIKPTAAAADLKASMQRGKKVYSLYCLACHQADGSGVPRMNPPLIRTKWVLGDKNQLINLVLKGMDEEIDINGDIFTNPMAAHNFLTDQEVADVLTYIRNSFRNKGSLITTAEVKAVRSKIKS